MAALAQLADDFKNFQDFLFNIKYSCIFPYRDLAEYGNISRKSGNIPGSTRSIIVSHSSTPESDPHPSVGPRKPFRRHECFHGLEVQLCSLVSVATFGA